jgi:hypothetical protein
MWTVALQSLVVDAGRKDNFKKFMAYCTDDISLYV